MRRFVHSLIALLFIHCGLFAKPALTVWIRSFGEKSAEIIVPYLNQVTQELSADFELQILVGTKPQDPVLYRLGEDFSVLQTDLNSISQGINDLVQATPQERYVLSLSQGVIISTQDVKEAIARVEEGAWVHGWQLSNLFNDGSVPGKGWYHTAALYPARTIDWMKTHPLPSWVDNGVDGFLVIDGESISIGGNEEVVLMGMIIRDFPDAIFLHNTRTILPFSCETGTNITFEQKLKRKMAVAEYYLKTHLQIDLWNHLCIID